LYNLAGNWKEYKSAYSDTTMTEGPEHENNITYKVMQPLLLGAFVAIGMMVGYKMNDLPQINLMGTQELPIDSSKMTGRVEELIRFIDNRYVEDLDENKLIDEALNGVFSKLDPHSVYIAPEEVQDVADQMDGNYHGIGIENLLIDDTLCISRVLRGSPAEKGGLKAFDKVLEINGKPVTGKDSDWQTVRGMLRKQPGEEVRLKIRRDHRVMDGIVIKVDQISVPTVHAGLLPGIRSLYLRIDRFGANTYKEFMEEVEKYFKEGKASHLIIDLRGNPGGFLPEATNILCQIFSEKGKLLLYTEGRNSKRNEYKTNGKRFFEIDRVVVLIDENSASASEIVAGAIQDWDRGVIVGRRSFGKGLVQEQYDLNNGGAVRLTVAKYFTPSGRSIQRDYADRDLYEQDHSARVKHGDLFNKDSSVVARGHQHYTLLEKRKVEEAGGITPDIFIPLPTVYRMDENGSMKADMHEFVYRYLDKNRKQVPGDYKSFLAWPLPQSVSPASFAGFVAGTSDKVAAPADTSGLEQEIRSELAGFLFSESAGLVLEPSLDPALRAAEQVIGQKVSLAQISEGWKLQ
jgi:carboxyl-terminal processing protease